MGGARHCVVLNPESKADMDTQKSFQSKTHGYEERYGMVCHEKDRSHCPIFLISFSVHNFTNIAVNPCNIQICSPWSKL